MRVLADFHHQDLYHSFLMLFEDRLGFEIYRPIGLEWYQQGFWNVYPHPATAQQFLAIDQTTNIPRDVHGVPLPESACVNLRYQIQDGIYYVMDNSKGRIHRAITLDRFKEMDFDIVLSSMPQHIAPFNELVKKFHPRAKHIFHVGNSWNPALMGGARNILASAAPFQASGANTCFYHQEFDLNTFRYEPPVAITERSIHSYIHYMSGGDVLSRYKTFLPDIKFKTFGAGMEDVAQGTQDVANKMRASTFTWHYKPEGDGYGHVIHNTFAVGRPAIVWASQYNGKLASSLFQDLRTCIDMDHRTAAENAIQIRRLSMPEEHARMCEAAHRRFIQLVNFDEEFNTKIKPFLERLI